MRRGGRSEGKEWRERLLEGGREVEARIELLALSTPPTGPEFSHQRAVWFTVKIKYTV